MVSSIFCNSICFPSGFTQPILETNYVSHYYIELSRSGSYFKLLFYLNSLTLQIYTLFSKCWSVTMHCLEIRRQRIISYYLMNVEDPTHFISIFTNFWEIQMMFFIASWSTETKIGVLSPNIQCRGDTWSLWNSEITIVH